MTYHLKKRLNPLTDYERREFPSICRTHTASCEYGAFGKTILENRGSYHIVHDAVKAEIFHNYLHKKFVLLEGCGSIS